MSNIGYWCDHYSSTAELAHQLFLMLEESDWQCYLYKPLIWSLTYIFRQFIYFWLCEAVTPKEF
jgi:hypothetical protein